MFERFTDLARRVVVYAQEEARLLNHDYIGTEHILLGLLREGDGLAARTLVSLGISLQAVRQEVEGIIGLGKKAPSGHIPFTPRAKKVLELSLREALHLGHNYIGTEHILLGLVREGEGVAAQVLVRLGADLNRVRAQVIHLVRDQPGGPDAPHVEMGLRGARTAPWRMSDVVPVLRSIEQRLAAIERHLGIQQPHERPEPSDPGEAAGPEQAAPGEAAE